MKIEDWIAPENIGFIALGVVIGAVALVGVQAACDADVAARSQPSSLLGAAAPVEAPRIDEQLLRCAKLPIEQADDPKCHALWAAQRRKFLAPGRAPDDAAKPLDLFPTTPKTPASRARSGPPTTKSE
ncbi:MAG: putative entry exclusion protein TrbK-alt [Methylocystis sp.]|uniref:putative entry exclusion protein TrbK-alt n=1 Tax=Methylocystis sp. TaxID=1911079 RepID=UPI003DA36861